MYEILRTSGTLICGKVITKNEHGVFIKVLFLRKEVSRGDASKRAVGQHCRKRL